MAVRFKRLKRLLPGQIRLPRRTLLVRVTLIYTIGTLLLSATVAIASFELTRRQLLTDVQAQHRARSFSNAVDVRKRLAQLPTQPEDIDDEAVAAEYEADLNEFYNIVLQGLSSYNASQSMIVLDNDSIKTLSPTLTLRSLPPDLHPLLRSGALVADARYRQDGQASYVIGVRLDEVNATYYEVVGLQGPETTLSQLRAVLIGVAIFAALSGAILGITSARRALAPLRRIVRAAEQIADGDLRTRLSLESDQDLATLSSSFNNMVDRLNDRISREQRFTSDVSHELRSPLTTLAASLEVLEKRKGTLSSAAQTAVELLSDEVSRFSNLVEDLLEISKMEAGVVQVEKLPFRPNEFLEFVVSQSRRPDIEIQYGPNTTDLVLYGDKRRLAQVMTNLIDNAEKYAGGVSHISLELIDSSVEIAVVDSGPGVEASERDRIFERFGRIGSEAGNRADGTGTGLGLALVSEHVRVHGGQVWVTDRVDGRPGARFVVRIPLSNDGQDDDAYESYGVGSESTYS